MLFINISKTFYRFIHSFSSPYLNLLLYLHLFLFLLLFPFLVFLIILFLPLLVRLLLIFSFCSFFFVTFFQELRKSLRIPFLKVNQFFAEIIASFIRLYIKTVDSLIFIKSQFCFIQLILCLVGCTITDCTSGGPG